MYTNYFKKTSFCFVLLCIGIFISCDHKPTDTKSGDEKKFIKVQVSVPDLDFNVETIFNPNEFAKISWTINNNADSSYVIYLHQANAKNDSLNVNAMLFLKVKEQPLVLVSDNLASLYGDSRGISGTAPIAKKIKAKIMEHLNPRETAVDHCCTVTCSGPGITTMTCCNCCCSDASHGCAECCAH